MQKGKYIKVLYYGNIFVINKLSYIAKTKNIDFLKNTLEKC